MFKQSRSSILVVAKFNQSWQILLDHVISMVVFSFRYDPRERQEIPYLHSQPSIISPLNHLSRDHPIPHSNPPLFIPPIPTPTSPTAPYSIYLHSQLIYLKNYSTSKNIFSSKHSNPLHTLFYNTIPPLSLPLSFISSSSNSPLTTRCIFHARNFTFEKA